LKSIEKQKHPEALKSIEKQKHLFEKQKHPENISPLFADLSPIMHV